MAGAHDSSSTRPGGHITLHRRGVRAEPDLREIPDYGERSAGSSMSGGAAPAPDLVAPTPGGWRSARGRRCRRADDPPPRRSRDRSAGPGPSAYAGRTIPAGRAEPSTNALIASGVTPGWSAIRITAASLSSSTAWIAAASEVAWPSRNAALRTNRPCAGSGAPASTVVGVVARHHDDLVDVGRGQRVDRVLGEGLAVEDDQLLRPAEPRPSPAASTTPLITPACRARRACGTSSRRSTRSP